MTVSDSVETNVPHNMYNAAVCEFEHNTALLCINALVDHRFNNMRRW